MKKLILTATTILAISSTANAAPQQRFPNWYIGLGAGVAYQDKSEFKTAGVKTNQDWNAGSVLSASIGYQPPAFGGFRVEAEYSNHHQNLDSRGHADVNVGAINAYYDFFNSSIITPYVGGGLGYAGFDLGGGATGSSGGSDSNPIYQLMAGVAWEPNSVPNVAFSLGYRYFAPFSDPKTSGTKFEFDNHSVEAGAKFRF